MEHLKELLNTIWKLDTNQIAIISLVVTLLLFVLGKRAENRIKIYETRKEEYKKLINFFVTVFANAGKNMDNMAEDEELKTQILDMGTSLAIFGSRKLYKTYCFYRWITLDERLQQSRWYSKDMAMYCAGEIYQVMRKEIGLNNDLIPVDIPDLLSFYITDFIKPEFKKNYYKYRFRKFALKSVIFWCKVEDFLPIAWIYNCIVKPLFFTLFCIIRFPIKLLIITPIKQIKNVYKSKGENKLKS